LALWRGLHPDALENARSGVGARQRGGSRPGRLDAGFRRHHHLILCSALWSQWSQMLRPEKAQLLGARAGGEPMRLTRAVTQMRLGDANHAKIAALDALAAEYLRLCQQYTTFFCSEQEPDGYLTPCFESPLSQRGPRVALQHPAGI